MCKRKLHQFMEIARSVGNLSKDPNRKVGAIILEKDTYIQLSAGYNGFPRNCKETKMRWKKENKYDYVIHAELNAIVHAARTNSNISNSIMVVTRFPCNNCALAIIQAGIKMVCTFEPEWSSLSDKWKRSFHMSKELLDECGVKIVYLKS